MLPIIVVAIVDDASVAIDVGAVVVVADDVVAPSVALPLPLMMPMMLMLL